MLRRLEKRILVDLPTQQARSAMFRYHLPAIVSKPPVLITSQIDYDVVAGVSLIKVMALPKPAILPHIYFCQTTITLKGNI